MSFHYGSFLYGYCPKWLLPGRHYANIDAQYLQRQNIFFVRAASWWQGCLSVKFHTLFQSHAHLSYFLKAVVPSFLHIPPLHVCFIGPRSFPKSNMCRQWTLHGRSSDSLSVTSFTSVSQNIWSSKRPFKMLSSVSDIVQSFWSLILFWKSDGGRYWSSRIDGYWAEFATTVKILLDCIVFKFVGII